MRETLGKIIFWAWFIGVLTVFSILVRAGFKIATRHEKECPLPDTCYLLKVAGIQMDSTSIHLRVYCPDLDKRPLIWTTSSNLAIDFYADKIVMEPGLSQFFGEDYGVFVTDSTIDIRKVINNEAVQLIYGKITRNYGE